VSGPGRVVMAVTTGCAPWGGFMAGRATWIPEAELPALLRAHAVREMTPAEEKAYAAKPGAVDRRIKRAGDREALRAEKAPRERKETPAPPAAADRKGRRKPPPASRGPAIPPPFPGARGIE